MGRFLWTVVENYNKSVQVDREISVCCDLEKPIIPLRVSNEPLIR